MEKGWRIFVIPFTIIQLRRLKKAEQLGFPYFNKYKESVKLAGSLYIFKIMPKNIDLAIKKTNHTL